jgi:hypothetical protein
MKGGEEIHGAPALSRIDNTTEICSDCGAWKLWKHILTTSKVLERSMVMSNLTIKKMAGYTVAVYPDNTVHHAVIRGVLKYPYETTEKGEYRNACGRYTTTQIRKMLADGSIVWG